MLEYRQVVLQVGTAGNLSFFVGHEFDDILVHASRLTEIDIKVFSHTTVRFYVSIHG